MDEMYNDLAKAIIIQATNDYKRSRFVLDTIDLRNYKDADGKRDAITKANREIKSIELFFQSEWFKSLSGLDGQKALVGLENTYKAEYFPARMEELLDETKKGRYRINVAVRS